MGAKSVTWQALPFYEDSGWAGFNGHPALNISGQLILEGRPARTVGSYTKPKVVSYDVTLSERQADGGYQSVMFIPTGLATNVFPSDVTIVYLIYRGAGAPNGTDALRITQVTAGSATVVWGDEPFVLESGKTHHVQISVSAAGQVTLNVDGTRYDTGVSIPYNSFQIQVESWEPINRWTVKNFHLQ